MAGRGRGRTNTNADLGSPLRKPSTSSFEINSLKTTVSQFPPNNSETYKTQDSHFEPLASEISTLNISISNNKTIGFNETVEEICNTISAKARSPESLSSAAVDLFSYGLKGKDEAKTAALVVKNVEKLSIDELNFRSVFLDEMGSIFSNIHNIRKTTPRRFQNFVVLLCEISFLFPKILVVRNAMLEALGMLLDEGTNEDIYIFWEEMKKIGPRLVTEGSDEMDNLMMNVRKVILLSQTSNRSRCLLMECLELYFNDWKVLPPIVKKFYDSYI